MTLADEPSPSIAAPASRNQKKKQRQKRSKLFKRLAASQEGSLQQSATGNALRGWHDDSRSHKAPHTELSNSAASSAHHFTAHVSAAVSSGRLPHSGRHRHRHRQWMLPADRDGRPDSACQNSAADSSSGFDGFAAAPHMAKRQRLNSAGDAATAATCSTQGAAADVQHTVSATGKPQACGGRQDMTASLLVIQSLLTAPPQANADAQEAHPPAQSRHPAMHGNYHRYYGYRLDPTSGEDARLQVMERCWFAGRRCLDVGCNEGLVSLAVATRFGAAAMLGVDIDAALVNRACVNLSRERGDAAAQLVEAKRQGHAGASAARQAAATVRALTGVWFQQGDVAGEAMVVEPGSVDTAMCLSVTKWVHINAGDAGLTALFAALHAALRPGGLLLLEPQPWRSYKQALRKQGVAGSLHAGMLADLQLRPEGFMDYLQKEAGFRLVRELGIPTSARGFDRPMYLLEKVVEE